jgi:hypothetical protein
MGSDSESEDWEVLDSQEDSGTLNSLNSVDNIIRSDYFSVRTHPDDILSPNLTGIVAYESNSVDSAKETTVEDSGDLPSDGVDYQSDSSNSMAENDDVIGGTEAVSENSSELKIGDFEDATEKENPDEGIENSSEALKGGGEDEKKGMIWWKLPLELLKCCTIRVSPVWSMSVAAAVLGFVILGRRLHMMKKKSRSLQLKITVADKQKASQLMSKAARLNESFSVVKRVPVIRPSMPPSGATTWLIMNLR